MNYLFNVMLSTHSLFSLTERPSEHHYFSQITKMFSSQIYLSFYATLINMYLSFSEAVCKQWTLLRLSLTRAVQRMTQLRKAVLPIATRAKEATAPKIPFFFPSVSHCAKEAFQLLCTVQ